MIYTTFFLVVQFLMAGIWACVCLSVSFLSDYKIVVLIFPFFVQLILHVICTITNHIDYSSVYWVQPGHGIVNMICNCTDKMQNQLYKKRKDQYNNFII